MKALQRQPSLLQPVKNLRRTSGTGKSFPTAQKQVLDKMDADHAAAVADTAKATGLEEAAVEEMYGLYDFNMEIKDSDIEAMEKTEKFMEDTGMIENSVDVASLILDVK